MRTVDSQMCDTEKTLKVLCNICEEEVSAPLLFSYPFHVRFSSRVLPVLFLLAAGYKHRGLYDEFHVVIFNGIMRRTHAPPSKTACSNKKVLNVD